MKFQENTKAAEPDAEREAEPSRSNGSPSRRRRAELFGALALAVLLGALASRPGANLQPLWAACALGLVALGFSYGASSSSVSRRETAGTRMEAFLVVCIVSLGASLRFYALDFGFPFYHHPDEGPKGQIVARMIENHSFHPHYFLHPTLLLYLSRTLSLAAASLDLALDPVHQAVLAGRIVSALAGSLSVMILFLLGRRLISSPGGLLAAAILAVSPLHVTCSRYMKEDVLCIFFALAALHAAVIAVQEGRGRWLIGAGALAGLSAASKYTGALTVLFVLIVPILPLGAGLSRRVRFAALMVAPLGFLAGCPYAVIAASDFTRHFLKERSHMEEGHHGIVIDAWSQWWTYHLSRSIAPGIGVITTAAALFGLGLVVARQRAVGLLILAGALLFYLPAEWVRAKPPPQPERYVLGALPFLALAAAYAVREIGALGRRHVLGGAFVFAVTLIPAWRSIELARDIQPDTRVRMREWITMNLAGSSILIDASYSPRLEGVPVRVTLSKASKHPNKFTRQRLLESGNEYLLVNGFSYDRYFNEPRTNELMKKRFSRIFEAFELVKEFSAPSGSYGFHNPVMRLYRINREKLS